MSQETVENTAREHAQTCITIANMLSVVMRTAAEHCGHTPPQIEMTPMCFSPLCSDRLFTSGKLPVFQPSDNRITQFISLDLIAKRDVISPSFDINVHHYDINGVQLPRSERDTVEMRNDFITPLENVATCHAIEDFFRAAYGPQGHDVAMRTLAKCLEMEP